MISNIIVGRLGQTEINGGIRITPTDCRFPFADWLFCLHVLVCLFWIIIRPNIDNFGCLHLLSGPCFNACLDFLEVVGDDSLGMESDHMPS